MKNFLSTLIHFTSKLVVLVKCLFSVVPHPPLVTWGQQDHCPLELWRGSSHAEYPDAPPWWCSHDLRGLVSLPVHWHPVAGLFIISPDADFTSRGLVGAEVCHRGTSPGADSVPPCYYHYYFSPLWYLWASVPTGLWLLDVDKGQKTQQRHRNLSFKETWDGYVKD